MLLALFGAYTWATARIPSPEPELTGPAATLAAALPQTARRVVTASLFALAAGVIFVAAEPFAHGLVAAGTELGVDEFLLIQWLAPLASEAPEFIVALLFVMRAQAAAGLRTLAPAKSISGRYSSPRCRWCSAWVPGTWAACRSSNASNTKCG